MPSITRTRSTGLICESFVFQVPAPGLVLTAIKGLSHIASKLGVLTQKMKDFTRDPQILAIPEADPLTNGKNQRPATVAALVRADERLQASFSQITLPLLILYGTADRATVCQGSEYFHEHAGPKDKTLRLYKAITMTFSPIWDARRCCRTSASGSRRVSSSRPGEPALNPLRRSRRRARPSRRQGDRSPVRRAWRCIALNVARIYWSELLGLDSDSGERLIRNRLARALSWLAPPPILCPEPYLP